jgi:hypothetical protein
MYDPVAVYIVKNIYALNTELYELKEYKQVVVGVRMEIT